MSFKPSKSKKAKSSKQTSNNNEEKARDVPPLTLSKIVKILESPPHKANKSILVRKNTFIKQSKQILSSLSVEERYAFLNNHLNETKLNKWSDQKDKIMKISNIKLQQTPLSISWYNFTYAHTPIEASKIWYNFINLMIDFEHGSAECDLIQCSKPDCKGHLTIIDQLYSFVNTSDDSLYAISTQEFTVRGGFKLLLSIFNKCGVNSPIPPLILCCDEYKELEFLSHFVELDYHFLFAISPNEVRFSWITQMLRNGHPIMSDKKYVAQLLQKFYPKIAIEKVSEVKESATDEGKEVIEYEISKTADIGTGSMSEIGVFCWLFATLPNLLKVRKEQKKLLKREFAKYEDTSANSTLIDTMLDYLYWEERYINAQMCKIGNILMENKNEFTLFRYISQEYSGHIAMVMFIKQFIETHMENNRDTLKVLFDGNISENNTFYFKLIQQMYSISSMVSRLDTYFPYLLNKIVWNDIDQLLFDSLLLSILSYIERYVSDKSIMSKIMKGLTCASKRTVAKDKGLSKVDIKRQKTKEIALKWIINILKRCNNKKYTAQFVYHLGVLHFQRAYQNESVQQFSLQCFEELTQNEFEIDLVNYFMDFSTHIVRGLRVNKRECILWLLCRSCFEKAIDIFLFRKNGNKILMEQLFASHIGDDGKSNNVFLSLSQSVVSDSITNATAVQNKRVNIFKMLCKYGAQNGTVEQIQKCLLQKDEMNGKNALEKALENNYQPLYNEMKLIMF